MAVVNAGGDSACLMCWDPGCQQYCVDCCHCPRHHHSRYITSTNTTITITIVTIKVIHIITINNVAIILTVILTTVMASSYFSIAVMKHHNQSNL